MRLNLTITRQSVCRALALFAALAVVHALGWAVPAWAHGMPLAFMGETGATIDSPEVQATVKEAYAAAVDAIPDSNVLSAQLERTRKFEVNGNGEVNFHVKVGTGGVVANLPNDTGHLPRHSSPQRKNGKTGLVHLYASAILGGQAIALTKNKKGAWVSQLEDQMEDIMQRAGTDVERQMNGDGRGVLCTVETTPAGGWTTAAVQNAYGVAGGGNGTMLLEEDMAIAFVNPANGVERGRTAITAVDVDNDQITVSATVAGVVAGDYVVRVNGESYTGADATTNYAGEANGILGLCGTGDFENIAASVRRWNAIRQNAASATITEKMTQTLKRRIKTASGRTPTFAYTTAGISLEIQAELAALRRFSGETVQMKGGYEGLKLGKDVIVEGDLCPKGHFFQLNTESDAAGALDLVKKGFIDLDGAQLHRVQGYHQYRADFWMPFNAIWHLRNVHGVIYGGSDDLSITR